MKALLDTNILVYSYNKASPYQKAASDIIRTAMEGEVEAYIAPQVLYEFFAVVTNPKMVERPLSPSEAADICLELWECREIGKANPTSAAPKEVFQLAKERKLSRSGVFDCLLAVTAKENGVETIYTENVDDFKGYGFIKASNPFV